MATDTVFVYTMNRGIRNGAWSRYVFPWTCEHFAHLENNLYIRHGAIVSYVDLDGNTDDGVGFEGVIQWPWLSFGRPGVDKMFVGFDLVGDGTASVEVGYDQTAGGNFTAKYALPADTVPGQVIPFPVQAPSFSLRLTYDKSQDWQWNALQVYLNDQRTTA